MFELKEDEEEGEPPTRSILGLGRIEPSGFRITASATRVNGEPPTRSLLGLGGLEHSPLRVTWQGAGADGEPPSASLLGLGGIKPGPLQRRPLPLGADEEPPTRSILGLGGIRPSPLPEMWRPPRPKARPRSPETASASFFGLGGLSPKASSPGSTGEAASRSFFGLEGLPYGAPLPSLAAAPNDRAEPVEIEVPEFERDVRRRAEPAFPIERAILLSLVAHAAILLLLLFAPAGTHDPRRGLLAAFVPPEKSDQEKIPIIFREAPGPARPNPKKSDLSDADRRAGGGDPSKPRAESPFVAERPGTRGLLPGPRRPAGAPPPGTAVQQAEAGKGRPAPSAGEGASETTRSAEEGFVVPKSSSGASSQTPGGRSAPTLQGLNQAIRDAARGVGAQGEDGAGFPNPDGGFADSGPLSFDTTWYDWGPYAAEMIRRIKLHWEVPELARLGWKGKLTIRFFILADGRVEGATILSRSGVPPFDNAALQAIVTSSPFRPLPKDLGEDREGITVTFFYNIRPGEAGGGGTK